MVINRNYDSRNKTSWDLRYDWIMGFQSVVIRSSNPITDAYQRTDADGTERNYTSVYTYDANGNTVGAVSRMGITVWMEYVKCRRRLTRRHFAGAKCWNMMLSTGL